jgi:hypothetical protein
MRRIAALMPGLACAAGAYALLVRGAITVDLEIGRRVRPLGPIASAIAAPPSTVFEGHSVALLGQWWGDLVARPWEETVAASLDSIKTEAERRARVHRYRGLLVSDTLA